MSDELLGYEVLNYYNKYSMTNKSVDEIVKLVKPKNPSIFADGLGAQVRLVLDMDMSKAELAMKNLANAAGTSIPTEQTFYTAIRDVAMNPSFFEAAKFVAIETTKQVAVGAQAVGNAVIDSGKLVTWLLPIGVVAALYVIGKSYVGKLTAK